MRVVYTLEAHANLDAIFSRLLFENPPAAVALAERVDAVVARIAMFPERAPVVLLEMTLES